MNYLSIDHLIVYAFLSIMFIVGLWAGQGVKNIREYATANKMFGTAALVLTYLATEVGGQGVINIAGEAGTTGIIIIVAFMSFPLAFLIQGIFIAPKMARFSQCMTMGDVMGTLYNDNVKIFVGILGFITCICCAGAELVILGIVFESFLGISYHWGVFMGGMILTIYVIQGGIKSVTMTDVFQFLTLLVLLPVLTATALKHAGGISAVFTSVSTEKLQIWQHEKFSYYLVLFLSFGVFHFNSIDPALVQRILMAKSAQQIRNIYFTLAGFFTALFLVFMLIGLAGHQLYPNLPAANIVPHLIQELLPTGLRGLMMAGIVAVMMASIDSYLHAAGLSLVHDVIQPLYKRNGIKINELSWVRYATLLSGMVIIGAGLAHSDNLYALIFTSLEFVAPLLAFPLFTGIMGLKPHKKAFYSSTGVTLAIFALGKLLLPDAYSHFLPIICVVANGVVFLGMHIISNKGLLLEGASEREANLW